MNEAGMQDPITPIRVLLADDHLVVRAGIRQFLELSSDFQIIAEAGDGETAKQLIADHQPDVAVLDIQMPKASGIEVTRWMRVNHPSIGILVLTAFDDDPYVLAVLQAGANGYVLKTATPDEIAQAVREVHAGKSVLNEVISQKLIAQITSQEAQTQVESLTDRELEVLRLTAKGYTNKAIGAYLGISDRTVQGHLAHVFDKLRARSRTEAVMRAVSLGWIPPQLDNIADIAN
ncbi:MAG TPA: response regulator transcription factor [Anaerolineales bacterium]|nr:response regulator transcription factor [Anaerolineales bacterium]